MLGIQNPKKKPNKKKTRQIKPNKGGGKSHSESPPDLKILKLRSTGILQHLEKIAVEFSLGLWKMVAYIVLSRFHDDSTGKMDHSEFMIVIIKNGD